MMEITSIKLGNIGEKDIETIHREAEVAKYVHIDTKNKILDVFRKDNKIIEIDKTTGFVYGLVVRA